VGHRTSWGNLPQTPVFSLRSARCYWYSSITAPPYLIYNRLDRSEGPACRSSLGRNEYSPLIGLGTHPNALLVHERALPVTCEGPSFPNKNKPTAVMELYRRQRAERSEKTGVWGRIPQEARWLTNKSFGPGRPVKAVRVRGTWSGGSLRKRAREPKLCTSKCCSYDWIFSSFGAFSCDRLCKVL
jgi:hypothetical protein